MRGNPTQATKKPTLFSYNLKINYICIHTALNTRITARLQKQILLTVDPVPHLALLQVPPLHSNKLKFMHCLRHPLSLTSFLTKPVFRKNSCTILKPYIFLRKMISLRFSQTSQPTMSLWFRHRAHRFTWLNIDTDAPHHISYRIFETKIKIS